MQTCRTADCCVDAAQFQYNYQQTCPEYFSLLADWEAHFYDFYITRCDTNIRIKSQLKSASCEENLLVGVKSYIVVEWRKFRDE